MKLGIWGSGMIVQELLPVLCEQRPEKLYICGREHSKDRTMALAKQYRMDGYFLDPEAMFAPDLDTVYIALPNQLHFSCAMQAIQAGKHVIVEKPIAASIQELEALEAQADVHQVLLLEAMSVDDLPAFLSLKEHIGELGQIRFADFQFYQYSSRYDAFLNGADFPVFDPQCLGGALMDLNVYNLHTIVSLFGEPKDALYRPTMQRGIDISGTAMLDYGEFQAVASAGKNAQADVHSVIAGEEGFISIPVPMNGMDRYEITKRGGDTKRFDFSGKAHRLSYEFQTFDRLISERNTEEAKRRLAPSRIVTGLLERMRPYE